MRRACRGLAQQAAGVLVVGGEVTGAQPWDPHPTGLVGLGRLLPGDQSWTMGHEAGQGHPNRHEVRMLPL